jgi:hypothetical protein
MSIAHILSEIEELLVDANLKITDAEEHKRQVDEKVKEVMSLAGEKLAAKVGIYKNHHYVSSLGRVFTPVRFTYDHLKKEYTSTEEDKKNPYSYVLGYCSNNYSLSVRMIKDSFVEVSDDELRRINEEKLVVNIFGGSVLHSIFYFKHHAGFSLLDLIL